MFTEFLYGLYHTFVIAFAFNVPPTVKVKWRRDHGLKSHPTVKLGIEPVTSGL